MTSHKDQVNAFKAFLGLRTLPTCGEESLKAVKPIFNHIVSTIRPSPHLEQLVHSFQQQQRQHQSSPHDYPNHRPTYKQHFIDLATGIRLRYLAWPHAGNDVILLLHDISRCADCFINLATKLNERGYSVFALDLRGHGGTSASPSGRYSAAHLAEDVHEFIIAKDLYIRPVAVVGCGIGAVVGLTLAGAAPRLVGAVACIDFGIPKTVLEKTTLQEEEEDSSQIVPWWSYWLGQGSIFASTADCAAFLASPWANIGPVVLPALLAPTSCPSSSAAASPSSLSEDAFLQTEAGAEKVRRVFNTLSRPPTGAAQDAIGMLCPSATTLASSSNTSTEFYLDDEFSHMKLKGDPKFFFKFNVPSLQRTVIALQCHIVVIHSENSSMVAADDAATLASLPQNPASSTTVMVPEVGHHLLADAPDEVYKALVGFLEGPAVRCFDILGCSNKSMQEVTNGCSTSSSQKQEIENSRHPEMLGLRPLPQYSTLEEAQKALGPRQIPSAAAIEEELRKLRVEAGRASDASSDSEGEGENGVKYSRKRSTALSRDPADYFGFVG